MAKFTRQELITTEVRIVEYQRGGNETKFIEHRNRIFLNLDRVNYFIEDNEGNVYVHLVGGKEPILIAKSFDDIAPSLFT